MTLKSPKITRRSLAAAAGATAASGLILPRAGATPRITMPAARMQDSEPRHGGELIFGLSTDPSNFEPHVSTGAASASVKQMIYSTLLLTDENDQLFGDLAEEFGWIDGNIYELKIRQGVQFHDGSELTVDDVVFSLKRIQDPETAATNASFFAEVTDISAVDDTTVHITFNRPFAAFPLLLANANSLIVSQAWFEGGADPLTEMMGTGPFVFVERIPGVSITVERNPNYFLDPLPYLDAIIFQPMPDDTTRMTALRSNSVDFVDYVPYTQMDIIMEDDNFIFASDSTVGFGWVGFNHEMAPADDVNVRKAISHGMNRETMVTTAFAGHGSPITGGLIPEGMIGYSPDLEGTFNGDYDMARSLLDESGLNPLDIDMVSTSTYSVIQRPAEAAQAELQNADINVNLELQEWLTFRQTVADGTFPTHAWGTSFNYPDPDFLWNYMHSTGNSTNWFNFADEELDSLLEQGRFETDEALRNEIYHDVQVRAADVIPIIFTIRRTQGEAMSRRVQGYTHLNTWSTITLRESWLED